MVAEAQRRKAATAALLLGKKPQERKYVTKIEGPDGPVEVEMLFRAIGSRDYDALVTKYPPTQEQKREQLPYNIDDFAPALIQRTLVEPTLTPEEAKELWTSEAWGRGELMSMLGTAIEVCSQGLNLVDPTESA